MGYPLDANDICSQFTLCNVMEKLSATIIYPDEYEVKFVACLSHVRRHAWKCNNASK